MKRTHLVTRGYKEVREKINKHSKYSMSCMNCKEFYLAVGDKAEVCQNTCVLEYDMVVTNDNRVYCLQWKPMSYKETD